MAPWSTKKTADPKRGSSPAPSHSNSPISPAQSGWATKALNLSDKLGGKFNDYTDKWGIESFWPTSGDFPREMEKAARILKSFTSELRRGSQLTHLSPLSSLSTLTLVPEPDPDAPQSVAAPMRIPPSLIANARGVAIYSCFRTGWAPVGGGGGSGVVLARLPDGSWSAPAAICPTAVGAGVSHPIQISADHRCRSAWTFTMRC